MKTVPVSASFWRFGVDMKLTLYKLHQPHREPNQDRAEASTVHPTGMLQRRIIDPRRGHGQIRKGGNGGGTVRRAQDRGWIRTGDNLGDGGATHLHVVTWVVLVGCCCFQLPGLSGSGT